MMRVHSGSLPEIMSTTITIIPNLNKISNYIFASCQVNRQVNWGHKKSDVGISEVTEIEQFREKMGGDTN
ncbi:hypothetical protein Bhyg_05037 [Pseudolycoriella hygida]|uniref:Uncharacterized protein n=1 Tax=Pseudolycoriella hygida TaxID=35572 RepID=A0A9Q0NH19_9DIPT|nr:hypothetical protein Bhyg_05037 [Pseudolycoriella hygida]